MVVTNIIAQNNLPHTTKLPNPMQAEEIKKGVILNKSLPPISHKYIVENAMNPYILGTDGSNEKHIN